MKRILHITGGLPFPTMPARLTPLSGIEQRLFRLVSPRGLPALRDELTDFRPGCVHLHAPNPVAAMCLPVLLPRHVKLIVHWHSDPVDKTLRHHFARPFETLMLQRADVIVGSSARYIEGSAALAPFRAKCRVIPPAIDTTRLVPGQSRVDQIRWRYGDKPLLLLPDYHPPGKGLEHLLTAVALVRHDCRVVVGGTSPAIERLERTYASGRIHFTGHVPPDDLAAWYTAADVFLFPPLSRHESFGTSLIEAMWCGTPAVTFTVPGSGVNWVNLNGVTGIEVDNGNEEQLAAAIDHLLTHDEMRREYGRAARRRVEEHMTLEKIAPALEALYA